MASNIDDKELAWLEELAVKADFLPLGEKEIECIGMDGLDDDRIAYIEFSCNAVPALVAEVRRLREKVEPLDWWAECVYVMRWLNESRAFDDPFFEAMKSVCAAERAVRTYCE